MKKYKKLPLPEVLNRAQTERMTGYLLIKEIAELKDFKPMIQKGNWIRYDRKDVKAFIDKITDDHDKVQMWKIKNCQKTRNEIYQRVHQASLKKSKELEHFENNTNIVWKEGFKKTELSLNNKNYEIFEKIDSIGNRHYSMRGPLGKDMNNDKLLVKLVEIKEKKGL